MENRYTRVRKLIGEVLSQLLNVPILSGLLVTVFYLRLPPGEPNRLAGYLWSLMFLTAIPALSYLFYIPFKSEPHERTAHRQRTSSFIFMLVSYPLGWWVLSRIHSPTIYTAMLEIYSFVTLGLVIFNLFFRYKASGHAAGVSGPVASMVYIFGLAATPLLLLLPLVTWARMAARGHNFWQTVVGGVLSMVITLAVLYYYGFKPFKGLLW
jgi:hypothetical protein